MKKKATIITIILLLITSFIMVDLVKATDYEWIQDASFEQSSVLLENKDFEEGNSSWTFGSYNYVLTTEPYSGSNHLACGSLAQYTEQQLGHNLTVSDVIEISFYAKRSTASASYLYFWVYYINGSQKIYDFGLTETYTQYTFDLDDMQQDAEIYKIKFNYGGGSGWQYIDEVEIITSSGIGGESDYWEAVTSYAGFTEEEANTGIMSGYVIAGHSGAGLRQFIPYLNSDNITSISLYAKTISEENTTIIIILYFTDLTINMLQVDDLWINDTLSWTFFDFDLSHVSDGKILSRIEIRVGLGDFNSYTYVDDVSLTASVIYNVSRFSWYLEPSPIEQTTANFIGYTFQIYNFYGTIYDVEGNPTEEGVFTATMTGCRLSISDDTITDGEFMFVIGVRDVEATETLKIEITVPSGTYMFYIYATFYTNPAMPIIYPTPEGTSEAGNLIDWLVMFLVIFLPALLFAGGIYENNQQPDAMHISPVFGLIAGLILSVGIGVYTSIVPLWILVVIIVVVAILIAGMVAYKSD